MSPGVAAVYQSPANEWSTGWRAQQRDMFFFYKRNNGAWTFYCRFSTNNGAEQNILPVLRGALSTAATLGGDPVTQVNLTTASAVPPSTRTPTATNTASCTPSIIVLDVRDTSEWNSGHVSCAHHLPVQDDASLVQRVKDLALANPRGLAAPVVTYCYSGVRSGRAEKVLEDAGFTNVRNGGGYIEPADNAAKLQALCNIKDCGGNTFNRTMLDSALDRLSDGAVIGGRTWHVAVPALVGIGMLLSVAGH